MPKQVSCHTTVLCDVTDGILQYKINYTGTDVTCLMVEYTLHIFKIWSVLAVYAKLVRGLKPIRNILNDYKTSYSIKIIIPLSHPPLSCGYVAILLLMMFICNLGRMLHTLFKNWTNKIGDL